MLDCSLTRNVDKNHPQSLHSEISAIDNQAMIKLSKATLNRVRIVFLPEESDDAVRMLEEQCSDNLPFMEGADEVSLERVRFAAIRVSDGNISKLGIAIRLAYVDWRDLLVSAGFAEDSEAHKNWTP